MQNHPNLWLPHFPWPNADTNKYDRGHALVGGGPLTSTGATKLAAEAALRIGAGLVSVACDAASLPAYAASFRAVMTKLADGPAAFAALLADVRVTAVLLGPGMGVGERTGAWLDTALAARKALVVDADAITVAAKTPLAFFAHIAAPVVVTPHAGEFARLFGTMEAVQAARASGTVVVRKGARTIVASPEGREVVNDHATPFLATAGTGDVLAGMIAGLLAQGMPAFEAACAAVWMHGEAARRFGAGLIAEDIAGLLPAILEDLRR